MPEKVNYNPDILSCLANLSSDEVFTPPEIANAMLDMLPQELFENPDTKFLDPGCKSGVFLREIAKRLNEGLKDKIPDVEQRMDHIMKKQLFAIAITQITGLLSRRSVYCSKDASSRFSVAKFVDCDGNIRYRRIDHKWDGIGKKDDQNCLLCGASRKEFDRGNEAETHAYEFIHMTDSELKELERMKFDVIIGNPPYQLSDGGSAGGAVPIYQKFVEQAKKLDPHFLSMIIPARWYAGGRGLEEFRASMLNDSSIKKMVDYPKSRDCFQGVDIAGGVCFFLRDRGYFGSCEFSTYTSNNQFDSMDRGLNEFDVFIRDNIGISVIHKIKQHWNRFMNEIVEPVSPFGLRSFVRGSSVPQEDSITLVSSAGKSYIPRSEVKKGCSLIDKYKVVVGYLNPDRAGVNNASDGKSSVTTKISIYKPGEVITETYIVLGAFNSYFEAFNCATYVSTKFLRFLVFLTLSSMHITKVNFQFVPLVSFNEKWTDERLYHLFNLSSEEIEHIESIIRDVLILDGGENA